MGQREEKFGRDSEWGASEEREGGISTVGYRVLGSEREVQGANANFVYCSVLPRVLGYQHTTAKHHYSRLLVEGLRSQLKPTSLIFP